MAKLTVAEVWSAIERVADGVRAWIQSVVAHPLGWVLLAAMVAMLWHDLRPKPVPKAVVPATVRILDDSTVAELVAAKANAANWQSLYNAAEKLNHGKVIAAVAIDVPARSQVVEHDSLPTTVRDSSRWAAFSDSTFAGVISGVATAPPFPRPLTLNYTVRSPAFRPSIGFVQSPHGDSVSAVVVWQGQRFTIERPYYTMPAGPPPKQLGEWAEGLWDPAGYGLLRGGLSVRLPWGIKAVGGLSQELLLGQAPHVEVGVRKEW